MKTRFDIHQEITNRIVSAIEAGAGEFKLPWHRAASTRSPINATTGRAYRGVNILSLWITTQALGYEFARMGDIQAVAGARRQCSKRREGHADRFLQKFAGRCSRGRRRERRCRRRPDDPVRAGELGF